MSGASGRELMEALGHRSESMVVRYSHLADEHKRRVVSRLEAAVVEWSSEEPSPGLAGGGRAGVTGRSRPVARRAYCQ